MAIDDKASDSKKEISIPFTNLHDLVENPKPEYYGKYVVTRSFADKRVIFYGEDPVRTYQKAQLFGYPDPVLMYYPDPNVPFVLPIIKCFEYSGPAINLN